MMLGINALTSPQPFVAHSVVLAGFTGFYFAWARFGHFLTGEYPYVYTNPELYNRRGMFFNVVMSMALTVASFLTVTGLHELRDIVAKKAECDRQN